MNWLDIVLVCILAISIADGIWKGFTRGVIGLAAMLLGILLGLWFYGVAGGAIEPYLSSKTLANFLGFFIVFGSVQVAGALLGWALAKIFKWVGLSWLDRALGAGFGIVRGGIFAVAFLLAMMAFPFRPVNKAVSDSEIAPYVIEVSRAITYMAPREIRDGFQDTYDKVREIWEHAQPTKPASKQPPKASA